MTIALPARCERRIRFDMSKPVLYGFAAVLLVLILLPLSWLFIYSLTDQKGALTLANFYRLFTESSFYDPLVTPPKAGFTPDGARAADWYERAALAGNAEAQRKYGLLLAKGGAGLPADCIALVPGEGHEPVKALMRARGLVDVLIPRGGAGLISSVVDESTVPVI